MSPDTDSLQAELETLHQRIAALEQNEAALHTQVDTLTRERDFFKALVENAPDTISAADLERTIIYANPSFRAITGYGDKLIGMNARDIYADTPEHLTEMFNAISGSGSWEGTLTYHRRDGSTFRGKVSAFTICDGNGQPQAMAGIGRDISDRLKMEESVWQNRALLQGLLNYSPALISVRDTEGRFIIVNHKFCESVFAMDHNEVLGKKLSDLLPATASESLLAHDQEVLARKEAIEQQHIIPHHDDQLHTYLKISFPLYDTQGNVMAVGSIGQNITLLKLAEEENAYLQDQVIVAQYVALREATSPLCPLTDRMVFMPLIGAIDSERVQHITDTLLNGIAHQRANIAILDITGVTVMDEQVANSLIDMARAVKLLGARVILTGIGPIMAQTLVGLDADLSDVVTCGTLQSGLTYAVREYGVHFA